MGVTKERDIALKEQLAQRANPTAKPDPARTIAAYLEKMKPQIAMALPKHLTADRLARIALTNIRLSPKLLECSIESLMGAIMQAAQLGLEPGPLGHAYLVPYWNKKTGTHEATLIIGYKGLIDLARRSDQILSISAHIVYEHDTFEVTYGLEESLVHRPVFENRGKPKLAYMVAKLKGGAYAVEIMTVEEIEAIRRRSKSPDSGPWVTDWEEMARKTVVRRGAKYLPLAIEIQRAIAADETVKTEIAADMTEVIDVTATEVRDLNFGDEASESADPTPETAQTEEAPSGVEEGRLL